MKFCIALAFTDPSQWPALAREAESAGFDSLILSDHLFYPLELQTPYPYTRSGKPRWQPSTPWPDPLIAAAALGAVTQRLRFITSIYILPLRHPLVAAKQIATAALFSGGRLTLGIGAGWMREEFDLVDQPFERAAGACSSRRGHAEAVAGGHGRAPRGVLRLRSARTEPAAAGPHPDLGGGTADLALRRAATHFDGWVAEMQVLDEIAGFARKRPRLSRRLAARPESAADVAAVIDAVTLDDYRLLEEQGLTHLITVPWLRYGVTGDDLADPLRRHPSLRRRRHRRPALKRAASRVRSSRFSRAQRLVRE